jgi:hypothetical protein
MRSEDDKIILIVEFLLATGCMHVRLYPSIRLKKGVMPYSREVKEKIQHAGGCDDFLKHSTATFMNKSENFMAAFYYCEGV